MQGGALHVILGAPTCALRIRPQDSDSSNLYFEQPILDPNRPSLIPNSLTLVLFATHTPRHYYEALYPKIPYQQDHTFLQDIHSTSHRTMLYRILQFFGVREKKRFGLTKMELDRVDLDYDEGNSAFDPEKLMINAGHVVGTTATIENDRIIEIAKEVSDS